jgi:signal recognition particle subunit SEC65
MRPIFDQQARKNGRRLKRDICVKMLYEKL